MRSYPPRGYARRVRSAHKEEPTQSSARIARSLERVEMSLGCARVRRLRCYAPCWGFSRICGATPSSHPHLAQRASSDLCRASLPGRPRAFVLRAARSADRVRRFRILQPVAPSRPRNGNPGHLRKRKPARRAAARPAAHRRHFVQHMNYDSTTKAIRYMRCCVLCRDRCNSMVRDHGLMAETLSSGRPCASLPNTNNSLRRCRG